MVQIMLTHGARVEVSQEDVNEFIRYRRSACYD